jgi:TetR/AcrR family transcriptional regulator, transcriptional repressor for nem operon
MRRSRSETAATRERIVEIASKLFLEKGLAAVGMRDIMAAVGLTPGGFYRHFESKEQLIAEANGAAFERLYGMFDAVTDGRSSSEALEKIVSVYLGQSREGNTYLCPLSMVGAELSHCDLQVRTVAMDGYKRLEEMIAARLTHLSKAEARSVASSVVSTMVGAVMLAKIMPDKAAARSILSNAHALVRERIIVGGGGASKRREDVAVRRGRTRS